MIKYCVLFTLCAVLALGMTAQANTGATLFGPTGLLVMPTAETLGMGQANVMTDFVSSNDADLTTYGINAGLGYGIELGATEEHVSEGDNNEYMINAKWAAYKEGLVMPAIAVGALNVTDRDQMGQVQPYIVATKSLKIPQIASLSVSAGYFAGDFQRPMYGAKLGITNNLEILADYIPDYSQLSVGARWNFESGLGLQVGALDGDFTAGFTYARALGK